MTLEGNGRVYEHVKGRIVIYIPTAVHKDSAFPFKIGETVSIRIKNKQLLIHKKD